MSFWATFGANLALNLLSGSKGGQSAPIQPPEKFSTSGYRRGTGRRGSQATQSQPARVEVASGVSADSLAKSVLSRMLRETRDQVKVAKATKV